MTFFDSLAANRMLVSDGAWGTRLQGRGLSPTECPETWNVSRAEEVAAVAESYVEAGADMILTNSFGGNPFRLAAYGAEGRCFELNRAAARISVAAAGSGALVAGSMGPTGKAIGGDGPTEAAAYDGFRRQAEALAEGGARALCVETMVSPREAGLAVRAALAATGLPVFCTFVFRKAGGGGYRTLSGASVREAVSVAVAEGAAVVGTNCGDAFPQMVEIVREIRGLGVAVPILVHANAGIPVVRDGIAVYPEGPDAFAAGAVDLVAAGANILGGCCGTGPEHIRALVGAIRRG